MESLENKVAVVTGGGLGMGRALVRQLAAAGCHVAFCDVSEEDMAQTLELAAEDMPKGTRLSAHRCDVSSLDAMQSFRAEIEKQHGCNQINLLFNNAGIVGGQSFVNDPKEEWDRVFAVCWGGVYNGCRVFMPMLKASDAGHIVNTSSVNGFWACLGPETENSAYSTAKFAVKGFSESLVTDLRLNAPHVKVSVVMPGHIGTSIVLSTQKLTQGGAMAMDSEAVAKIRTRWSRQDTASAGLSDDEIRQLAQAGGENFRDNAPTTADEAARQILQGVKNQEWRILIGEDALSLDAAVRADPLLVYSEEFDMIPAVLKRVTGD